MCKKLITKTILLLFFASSIFAKSTKTKINTEETVNQEEVVLLTQTDEASDTDTNTLMDEYSDSESKSEEIEADTYEDSTGSSQTTVQSKKKNSFLSDLFTYGNKGKFIYTDESSCFYKAITGGLKQYASTTTIDPKNGEAGFGTKYQAGYYFVLIDKENRKLLNKAVDKYFSDFENKKLDRKGKHTDRIYGKMKMRLRWGTIKTSTPNNGIGDATIGYEFVENSPYFKITVPEIENEHYKDTDTVARGSIKLQFYFTKAQIKDLLNSISEDKISTAIYDFNVQEYGIPQDSDNY